MSIHNKALLANITIGMPPVTKKIRTRSEELESEHHTERNQVSVISKLFSQEDIGPLQKISNAARTRFREITLPYGRSQGLVPTSNYFDFLAEMGNYKRAYEEERDTILRNISSILANAAVVNGNLYDPNNYPGYEEMAGRMYFSIDVTPVPAANDYDKLADLTPEQIEVLKREAVITNNSLLEAAMQDLIERLLKSVKHAASRLTDDEVTGEQKIFKDTTISNIDKALEAVKTLNIEDNESLVEIAAQVESLFGTVSANDLRRDANLRKETAAKAAELAAKIGELF
jgi:hypothetical protein